MPSEFLRVAEQLLREEKRAMGPAELVELASSRKLFPDSWSGKTPHQTMKSKLSVDVRRKGASSKFVRTEKGKFALRELVSPSRIYLAPAQRKPDAAEDVLCFPAGALADRIRFQGISRSFTKLTRRLLTPKRCIYRDRLSAERDSDFKQVLTYVMITRGEQVLAYKRGNFNRVEDFLRGAHCVGFGGHVSKPDADLFGQADIGLQQGAIRELCEELSLPRADRWRLSKGIGLTPLGVLNDDSSDVGQRHIAFLFQYEVSDDDHWDKPERGEKSITQLRWLSPNSGLNAIWDFEYWSQLCLRQFFPKIAHAAPSYRTIRRQPLRAPHLLCVLGEVGSGKSEATKVLRNEYGYTEINSGRVLAKLLSLPPVPVTPREDFQKKAWQFINKTQGPKQLAAAIWKEVEAARSSKVLIDGIRQRATLKALKSVAKDRQVGILFVHTVPDVAYKFYTRREASGISIFDFLRIRRAEVEKDVASMITQSDAVLYNWMGQAEYRSAIHALMQSVSNERGNE